MTVDAQLMSPSEPVCPENRVIFTCQQSGALARWTITLPSAGTLRNTAQSPQYGSVLIFMNDPGFNFEIHIIAFHGTINITTELRITAVRELNGTTMECTGSRICVSTIQVASVGELIIILLYLNLVLTNLNVKTLQLLQVESQQPISTSQKLEPQ